MELLSMKKPLLFILMIGTGVIVVLFGFLILNGIQSQPAVIKTTWTDDKTGIRFTWIDQGDFQMGSKESEEGSYSTEYPAHEVQIDGFWMGTYELTNREYRLWRPEHNSGEYYGYSLNDDNQPVVKVSWEDAKAFTEWLTKQHEGKFIFRLPTEAEWEYAARAGTTTNRYWGNNPNDACEYANVADKAAKNNNFDWGDIGECNDGYPVSSPVGKFRPNSFGLMDMLGNVWEWCSDWMDYNYYASSPKNNPPGPSAGKYRIFRGGSWWLAMSLTRSATRFSDIPEHMDINLGFRIVREGPLSHS
jgi:formylglycine-generating enzyme